MRVINLGIIPYKNAYALQKEILSEVISSRREDTLILCEHPHTFTIGRSGSKDNILADKETLDRFGIRVCETDRGGDITYHGPGQLVVYPILNLAHFKKDIHWYLRVLEQAAIDFLAEFGIFGHTKLGSTGVWVNANKIASIGIGIKRWVTYHGIAININTDLSYFDYIVPCGLQGVKMASAKELLGIETQMPLAKEKFTKTFMDSMMTSKINLTN